MLDFGCNTEKYALLYKLFTPKMSYLYVAELFLKINFTEYKVLSLYKIVANHTMCDLQQYGNLFKCALLIKNI